MLLEQLEVCWQPDGSGLEALHLPSDVESGHEYVVPLTVQHPPPLPPDELEPPLELVLEELEHATRTANTRTASERERARFIRGCKHISLGWSPPS